MGYSLSKKNPLYELIADYTVSGSAISSYTFSNLNLIKDEDYVLVSDVVGVYSSNTSIMLTVNGNDTGTNYYWQYLSANNSTVGAGRSNAPMYSVAIASGGKTFGFTRIKLTNNGYMVTQTCNEYSYSSSSTAIQNQYTTSTFTMGSITSITLSSDGGVSALGIGTRFQLYRIRPASKIADVTIGSATTSYTFDLSATPIGKGSEFMLVSDIYGNPKGGNYSIYINSNTTATNYYFQLLNADSTTILGGRYNFSRLFHAPDTARAFSIAQLKLTNNGYFVWQSNVNSYYGTSSAFLQNDYGTSTFTSTSITSLTITAENTNAITVGSRFQLYKLKCGR